MLTTFEDDIEKVADLCEIIYENNSDIEKSCWLFLSSYSYLTYEEVKNTALKLNADTLSDLMREAENMYIEELNNRKTGKAITSEQAKTSITNYVYNSGLLTKEEQKEFEDFCSGMAV